MNELQAYLASEVTKRISEKIENLKNYAEADSDELYLVDDLTSLLNIKSIGIKVNNLIENQEKFSKVIIKDEVMRKRILINKIGACKIIASMRKKPHELICNYFNYQALIIPDEKNTDLITKARDEWVKSNSFEVNTNNIYIRRLKHIFVNHQIETFYTINNITLDIFFPKYGIVILFNKKTNLFDEESVATYIEVQKNIIEKYPHITELKWIQFTSYDKSSRRKFDELLKDIINIIVA